MDLIDRIREVIASDVLTVAQKVPALARIAENILPYPEVSAGTQRALDLGVLCDLGEGHAPYRPRYVLPDYQRLMVNGSEYLKISPPEDLEEAIHALLAFYHHVPSITGFPVYLGALDTLLEPFATAAGLTKSIKLFVQSIDRMFPDAFAHANLGPWASRVGEAILDAEAELLQPVPNLSLKYRAGETETEYVIKAVKTALIASKPYFVNDALVDGVYPGGYGIASCYNILPLGGGSYTLVRINLKRLLEESNRMGSISQEDFLGEVLPLAVAQAAELANARIRFLVEESGFFKESFLVKEGFISQERFTAMVGVVGMAEAVNGLLGESSDKRAVYGRSQEANELAYQMSEVLARELSVHDAPFCQITGRRLVLHAQVGINSDIGVTPGTRIPVGDEPELLDFILAEVPHHRYFTAGTSTILPMEESARENPKAVLDVIHGAFAHGAQVLSVYCSSSDVVRVSGYLVRKSDMKTVNVGGSTTRSTDSLAAEGVRGLKSLERKVFGVSS